MSSDIFKIVLFPLFFWLCRIMWLHLSKILRRAAEMSKDSPQGHDGVAASPSPCLLPSFHPYHTPARDKNLSSNAWSPDWTVSPNPRNEIWGVLKKLRRSAEQAEYSADVSEVKNSTEARLLRQRHCKTAPVNPCNAEVQAGCSCVAFWQSKPLQMT